MDDLDWIRDIKISPYNMEMSPKIGDTVMCIPGFKTTYNTEFGIYDLDYGGKGYTPGRICVADFIMEFTKYNRVVIVMTDGSNVFSNVLTPYNK